MTEPRYRIEVPRLFAQDHVDRCLPTGIDQRSQGKRCMVFHATLDEIREWLSDADYYSDCAGQGWGIGNGLAMQASARATRKRMTMALEQIDSGHLKPIPEDRR